MTDPTLLYEAILTNHTPAMIGGANRGWINIDGSIDYPRPTDIAGKTRWWLRAILAGGIYEEYGYTPPINRLDRIAGEIMGKIKPVAQASKITIELRPENHIEYVSMLTKLKIDYKNQLRELAQKHGGINNPKWHSIHYYCLERLVENNGECPEGEEACCALASPRVLLTVMGKSIDEAVGFLPIPPEKLRLKLRINKRLGASLSQEEEELIGLALGLAIYASGIGKAQTRGYGKLKPIEVKDKDTTTSETIERTHELINEEDGWKIISRSTVEYVVNYLKYNSIFMKNSIKIAGYNGQNIQDENSAYTLHLETINVWSGRCINLVGKACSIKCSTRNSWCTVTAVNKAILKSTMKKVIFNNAKKMAPVPITVLLGLPRQGKIKYNIYGYIPDRTIKTNRLLSTLFYIVSPELIISILFKTPAIIKDKIKDHVEWVSKYSISGYRKFFKGKMYVKYLINDLNSDVKNIKNLSFILGVEAYGRFKQFIKNELNLNIDKYDLDKLNYINAVIINELILGLQKI